MKVSLRVMPSYNVRFPALSGKGRFIKIEASTAPDDVAKDEDLEVTIILCLAGYGYQLTLPLDLEAYSMKMLFFVLDTSKEMRVESRSVIGTGSKGRLCTYRPIVRRRKSSFLSSFKRKAFLKRKIRRIKFNTTTTTESLERKPAWFQQTSSDAT